jgi:uncharacterized protein YdbL (DUF1318 family)
MTPRLLCLTSAASLLAGCASPTVKLATTEPIKMDINVRLDVYQHNPPNAKAASTPSQPAPASARRNRMGDIQNFKNQHLVGEARDGLLVLRAKPDGDYGDYVRQGVEAENADRMTQMKSLAESQKLPLTDIQTRQAAAWRERSFPGEWIEAPAADGSWQWVQKGS